MSEGMAPGEGISILGAKPLGMLFLTLFALNRTLRSSGISNQLAKLINTLLLR